MTLPVYVTTSGRYLWALRPFAWLFNRFWSEQQLVRVITDLPPKFGLPPNFTVEAVGGGRAIPANRWSDSLIAALELMPESHLVLLLEDYWLVREVDQQGLSLLAEFAAMQKDLLRLDLTDDRQYNGHARDVGYLGRYDLVETPGTSEYQMSLQAAIWNRDLLLSVLKPGLSPWDVELSLSPELHGRQDLRVIGTRQCPVRYINVFKNSEGQALHGLDRLPLPERQEIEGFGWLQPG